MLFKLLGAPLGLPLAGMKFVLQQLADLTDQELYDDGVVREQLLLLQVQLEDGDIGDDEYAEREAELLARLREIRARKQAELEQAAIDDDDVAAEANAQARRRVVIETPFDE
jgi:Gas vesicle protein G